MSDGLTIICHGARGSTPTAGDAYRRYGGFTTCFEILTHVGQRVLIDCGTGLYHLEPALHTTDDHDYHMLFTHYHWDHTQGIPFFTSIYDPDCSFTFYGRPAEGMETEAIMDQVMGPPWFPAKFSETPSEKAYVTLNASTIAIGDLQIATESLHHPSGVTAYRFDKGDSSLVVATDVEPQPESDERLIALARGADLLIHDAQYLPNEYPAEKLGWGHSTWEHAVAIAQKAEVGRLVLTSHDPHRTDDQVDQILESARRVFPDTEAAFVGWRAEL